MFNQGILNGKYHCTVDLLFDWFESHTKEKRASLFGLLVKSFNIFSVGSNVKRL